MNEKQKIVSVIVAVVVLAMLLDPPFHIIATGGLPNVDPKNHQA